MVRSHPTNIPHVTTLSAYLPIHITDRTLMHDERYFNEPFKFIPERFLPEGKDMGLTAELDPLKYVFGFGRR